MKINLQDMAGTMDHHKLGKNKLELDTSQVQNHVYFQKYELLK